MKKNIIVTGGAGFVGSNMILLLLNKTKYNIISIDNYSTGSVKNHIKEINTFFLHKLSIKIEDDLDANISINNHSYFGSEFSEPFTSNEPIVIIIQKNGYKTKGCCFKIL